MLEHALVHPMRHRLQLERALAGAVDALTRGPVQPGSTLRLLRFHSHHRELIIYSFPSRTSPIGADRAAAAATRGAAGGWGGGAPPPPPPPRRPPHPPPPRPPP